MPVSRHRLRPGTLTPPVREVGSSVYHVFEGRGSLVINGEAHRVEKGDLVVVPSWALFSMVADTQFDLFHFGDHPIIERLNLDRSYTERTTK